MTTRDEALAEIATWKAELNGLPQLNTFDVHDWGNNVESGRIRGLNIAALVKEFNAAEQKDAAEQKRIKSLELLRGRMGLERNRLGGFIREQEALVRGDLLPANLSEAIRRLEADISGDEATLLSREQELARIEWRLRDTKAREKVGYNLRPNSQFIANELAAAKVRLTPLRARLTRTRAAAAQLRALIMVAGDISNALRAALTELHEANMAADVAAVEAPATVQAAPKPTEAEYLAAHGVIHDTVAEIE